MPGERHRERQNRAQAGAEHARAVRLRRLGALLALVATLLVAALAVPLAVLVASWAGFAMSRLPRRAVRASFTLTAVDTRHNLGTVRRSLMLRR